MLHIALRAPCMPLLAEHLIQERMQGRRRWRAWQWVKGKLAVTTMRSVRMRETQVTS
jgi:hypothetical protein